jgi:hypothetical protein
VAKINQIIDDQLDDEFRNGVLKKYGMRRGNLKKALEEALVDWIKKNRT